MQLVCEGHLRSFTGNTYVRLWGTLACACEEHLLVLVRKTKIKDPLCPTDISPVEGETMRGVRIEFDSVTCIYHLAKRCAPTHHAPRTIFNFSSSHQERFNLFFIIYAYIIKIYIHSHDAMLRTIKKRKWCVVRGALRCMTNKI